MNYYPDDKYRKLLEDHSMFLQKPKCHAVEHHPVWDGNYYTCSDCGLEFMSIKRIKNIIAQERAGRVCKHCGACLHCSNEIDYHKDALCID